MKRFWAAALAATAFSGMALAAGYDDFTAAIAASNRDDFDAAIASYTAALKAGDLAPPYIPAAHRMRALAYLYKKKCRESLTDFESLAALAPLDRFDLEYRAYTKACLDDLAGTKQDLEAAMGPVPDREIYEWLGWAQWRKGFFAEAAVSFANAVEVMPKKDFAHGFYLVLWYAMAADRTGKLDPVKLTNFVDALVSPDWPMPLIELFRGRLKPDEVRITAEANDKDHAGQLCEADFYTAEWHIVHTNTDTAKPLIARAAAQCPKAFVEYGAARTEAGRLGLSLPPEAKP